MSVSSLRLAELVGMLALGQDNAFGQPLESQLRSCLLACWLSERAGLDAEMRATCYWVALLRYVGCTGHAHEVAAAMGDEIGFRALTLLHDAANPAEVLRDAMAYLASAGPPDPERARALAELQREPEAWARHQFTAGCEVGDLLVERLGFGASVREALRFTFERYNGNGFPSHARGEAIPLAMRVVHLTHDAEALARRISLARALEAVRERRGSTYDPVLADMFVAHGGAWLARLTELEPWDATLALEPLPRAELRGEALDAALSVVADFVDLKSPFWAGHSRRCAELAARAAQRLGFSPEQQKALERAGLLHDLGATALPNSIWDKPGPLTRAERDRVELHPELTGQMLRRAPALADVAALASSHHARPDGSGYPRRRGSSAVTSGAAVLACADVLVALTADRADRPAMDAKTATAELRREAAAGRLEPRAAEAVLASAGQRARLGARAALPGGLTRRELELLRLAAGGLTTRAVAERLGISAKTADHHLQSIYGKIGVSTRAAATLWAVQQGVIFADWLDHE